MSQPVATPPLLTQLKRWCFTRIAHVTPWAKMYTPSTAQQTINQPILSEQAILLLTQEYAQIPPFITTNHRISHAQIQGSQNSPFLGSGMEYEESRPYEMGDEIRHLNWRLMAKTGKAYTKYFQETRQENWVIVVDHRTPMRFGTQTRLKATQASRIAGYFAWSAQKQSIPVVGVRLTDTLTQTPPQTGRGSYEKLMQLFSQPCPPANTATPPDASLNDLLHSLLPKIKAGAHCILISDFHDANTQTCEQLIALQQKAMITALCIQDPAESLLPNITPLQLQTMQAQHVLTVQTKSQQQAYKTWAQQHQQAILSTLQSAGISPITVQSNAPLNTLGNAPHLHTTAQESSHA